MLLEVSKKQFPHALTHFLSTEMKLSLASRSLGQLPMPRSLCRHGRSPTRRGRSTGCAPIVPAELYASADRPYNEPEVDFRVLCSAALLLTTTDAPGIILVGMVKALAQHSPIIIACMSKEDLEWIMLLKNPCNFAASLMSPSPLDGLVYGFTVTKNAMLLQKQELKTLAGHYLD